MEEMEKKIEEQIAFMEKSGCSDLSRLANVIFLCNLIIVKEIKAQTIEIKQHMWETK